MMPASGRSLRAFGVRLPLTPRTTLSVCAASRISSLPALLGSRALKIERFGFFSCYRHTQLLFPALPE